jgi:hypothetical protein
MLRNTTSGWPLSWRRWTFRMAAVFAYREVLHVRKREAPPLACPDGGVAAAGGGRMFAYCVERTHLCTSRLAMFRWQPCAAS